MTAIINWEINGSTTIHTNRKENNYVGQYTMIDRATCANYAELRFYCTNSRAYACFWLFGREKGSVSGGAYAGGYGYHRKSAAAANAFEHAGITFDEDIAGRGDGAVRDALEAIGRACGIDPVIIEAHA